VAYSEALAKRIREILQGLPDMEEKKMFGGVGFLLQGNMACGVNKQDLIVRLDPARTEEALARPHVRPFGMGGRTMQGWIMVAPEGYESDSDLRDWVQQGVDFALSLAPK
jgi:TfoX/Sxy family transcriptional regulator of competence genes